MLAAKIHTGFSFDSQEVKQLELISTNKDHKKSIEDSKLHFISDSLVSKKYNMNSQEIAFLKHRYVKPELFMNIEILKSKLKVLNPVATTSNLFELLCFSIIKNVDEQIKFDTINEIKNLLTLKLIDTNQIIKTYASLISTRCIDQQMIEKHNITLFNLEENNLAIIKNWITEQEYLTIEVRNKITSIVEEIFANQEINTISKKLLEKVKAK